MEKLVVMDTSDSSVNIYSINDSDDREVEDILSDLGHDMDDCFIMWCDRVKINLED